jgi:hypothetical protein
MVHRPRPPREGVEGQDLARWLRRRGVRFCHVPNGGTRGKREAAKLVAEGVEAGVPDYLVFDRPTLHPHPSPDWPERGTPVGVAIELKRVSGDSGASAEQTEWLEALRARGWVAFVAHGAKDAQRRLTEMGIGME